MINEQDLEVLRAMEPATFDGTIAEGFHVIMRNNLRQNFKKGNARTAWQVKSDTAKGIGLEEYLMATGLFRQAAPPVLDPDNELEYSDRQKDFWYGEQSVQVKAITKLHGPYVYVTEAMQASIRKSLKLNDMFLFGLAESTGNRDQGCTVYTYQPAFVISSWALSQLMLDLQTGGIDLSSIAYRTDHFQAIYRSLL